MNILHAIFTQELAGSERYCADLANLQAQKGHTVTIMIRPQTCEPNIKNWLNSAVRVIEVPKFLQNFRLKHFFYKNYVDILHTHLGRASRAMKDINLPKVATLHIRYKPKEVKNYDGLICISAWQKEDLNDFKGFSEIIGNWLPALDTPDGARVAEIRAQIGATEDTFVIGSVGRLHPNKGMDVLIEAFKAAKLNNTKLVIVGEGEEAPVLKNLVAGDKNIHLVGAKMGMIDWYAAFDTFVSAARFEPFGLVLLEAMAAKCPIICTKTEGPKSFLPSHVHMVAIESVLDITNTLKSIYAQGRKRERYNLDAFNPIVQVDKIEMFYKKILKMKKSAVLV